MVLFHISLLGREKTILLIVFTKISLSLPEAVMGSVLEGREMEFREERENGLLSRKEIGIKGGTGKGVSEKEVKGIFEKEGNRDGREGREKGSDRRKRIEIEEKDRKRD